ncbi:glycoside hydrolase family 25 protein [Crucibulum laeve]|uniref:N,O-diacetylmuramidase n=1 Tax=Crucibulum laeve TaxID=68775 RepID=A0A5C3M1F1_9AGAR|nr:glycoside hydrolase family 25 protein [Crucibulum laeve]
MLLLRGIVSDVGLLVLFSVQLKMKLLAVTLAALSAIAFASPVLLENRAAKPHGVDVSHFQPNVNFKTLKSNGLSFVFIKATEGTTVISDTFSKQYTGATNAGLIRGAYHFAHPGSSTGAAQANFFLKHGGITLPGVLDIEYNPNGAECYGLTHAEMVSWVKSFSTTYHKATTRYPIIYTTTDWWKTCTGNSAAFGSTNPLWIARYVSAVGTLPAGWSFTTFWQYADSGPNPGDQDLFNGDMAGLKRMAKGS